MRVCAERSVTVVKKHLGGLESLSTPPKTQQPSTRLPRLYFLLPNLLSSISTTLPGPPIGSDCCSSTTEQTSRQKLKKVYDSSGTDLKFVNNYLLWIFMRPEINYFTDSCKKQMGAGKKAMFTNSNVISTTTIRTMPNLAVGSRLILPQIHSTVTTTRTVSSKTKQNLV